jgi:arylsulfatase A-like enzyme
MNKIISLAVLCSLLTSCLLGTPALSASLQSTTKTKPNIVFILTDDLDAAEIQYMPKLKALVTDQGETLTNYFLAESLCCPSRTTTLRGQYSHNTQILGNSLPSGGFDKFYQLGEEKSTIAVWLQAAGYRTLLSGKYLNGYPLKKNPLYIPPGWNEFYSPMKGDAYGEFNYSLNENGKQVAYGNKPQDYGTDVYVGKAVDFIQRTAKAGKPFFVYLTPYAPHAPYTPAPRHADLFPGVKAPRTPNFNEADVSDKPAYILNHPLLTSKQIDAIDQAFRKRLQSLQAVDEGIGSIVDTLKATGQLDNTYIFFTSDNGYHLGNHRQMPGKVSPYDEEMRVTMIVRGPGVPAGKTLAHLTGNVDLAPTWAELAGAKAASFCDGRSLVPLLGNNPPALSQWRQAFPFEFGIDQITQLNETGTSPGTETGLLEPQDQDEKDLTAQSAAKKKILGIPAFRGLRLQTVSYVEYITGEKELYDLKADPYQLQNLASSADPKLLARLSAYLKTLATCKAAGCQSAENAPFNLPASLASQAPPPTASPGSSQFGVFVGKQNTENPQYVQAVKDLGATWVRVGFHLGVKNQDYIQYLSAGINVILTVANEDPANIVTTYGTPQQWPNAGWPFKSKDLYEQEIRSALQPAQVYLKQGQKLWVQADNEVTDAAVHPAYLYWRGTDDQYLVELQALYEAVKSVDPNIPVVLNGISSETLAILGDPKNKNYPFFKTEVSRYLTEGKYDVVDLHFYECVESIPAKIATAKQMMPAGHPFNWISTENGGPHPNCKTSVSWRQNLAQFEQMQAQQVPARLSACVNNGGSICMWFSLFDLLKAADAFSHLGLLDPSTNPPTQKPAYAAYKLFVASQGK